MVFRSVKLLKWVVVLLALAGVLGMRAFESQRGPPLQLWQTYVPHANAPTIASPAGARGLPPRAETVVAGN